MAACSRLSVLLLQGRGPGAGDPAEEGEPTDGAAQEEAEGGRLHSQVQGQSGAAHSKGITELSNLT